MYARVYVFEDISHVGEMVVEHALTTGGEGRKRSIDHT